MGKKDSGKPVWTVAMVEAHNKRHRLPPPDEIRRQPAAVVIPAAAAPRVDALTAKFEGIWSVLADTPPYIKELEGIDGRRYRFDYAFIHPVTGKPVLLIELEGLTREGGRHQRSVGFESDAEKYFLAGIVHGWIVVRLTKKLITPTNLVLIRNRINELFRA